MADADLDYNGWDFQLHRFSQDLRQFPRYLDRLAAQQFRRLVKPAWKPLARAASRGATKAGPPRFGRPRGRRRSKSLATIQHEQTQARAAARVPPPTRPRANAISDIPGIRGSVVARGALPGIGELTFPGGNPFWVSEYASRIFDGKRGRFNLVRASNVGRRGALATRPFVNTGRTNRTGAGTQRTVQPSPDLQPAPTQPGPARKLPPGVDPVTGGDAARRASTGARKDTDAMARSILSTARGTLPTSLPRTSPSASPATISLPRLDPWGLPQVVPRSLPRAVPRLSPALAPRAVPLMPQIMGVPQFPQPAPGRAPGRAPLTGLNTGLLPFQQPVPQEDLDKCKCPPKKKTREKGCSNPLVSRSIKDGIITIKRKLLCQPSKPKLRSVPV